MRIISFTEMWEKLQKSEFTTFRLPRIDEDWFISEQVQVYYKSRSPKREKLGVAVIIGKEARELDKAFFKLDKTVPLITNEEAQEDGFKDSDEMFTWLEKQYGRLDFIPRMNKLTLRWMR